MQFKTAAARGDSTSTSAAANIQNANDLWHRRPVIQPFHAYLFIYIERQIVGAFFYVLFGKRNYSDSSQVHGADIHSAQGRRVMHINSYSLAHSLTLFARQKYMNAVQSAHMSVNLMHAWLHTRHSYMCTVSKKSL